MGCASSTEAVVVNAKNEVKTATSSTTPSSTLETHRQEKIIEKETTLGSTETAAAISSTDENMPEPDDTLVFGKFRVRFAALSRKGRDPDFPTKPNQDCFSIDHKFGGAKLDNFFGVYDGHGPTGEACSQFVQQRLPALIAEKIRNHDDFVLTTDQIHESLREAHTQCNEELHALKDIDDTSSGTTSITMYMQGEFSRITISNVGDSRAVLGTATQQTSINSLRAVPLSNDQTPRRPDEVQRCVRSGARILSFGQISGNDDDSDSEDPPRVWAQNGKYPGTAFSRSIGDSVAKKLGVSAEPEMLSLKVSSKEKVIVLATDGIFDVMSNQEVIDKCFQYYNKDPAQACSAVIENSHAEWLLNEECKDEESASYDDMTMVCVFIYDDEGDEVSPPPPTPTASQQHHPRRVRQKTLRNLEEFGA